MKNQYLLIFSILFFVNAGAQSVAINTDGSVASDPKAMLEIKKVDYSKLRIRTTSFLDTSVLELSNRSAAGSGTDFLFSHIRETGLILSSRSDIPANNRDSIMTVTPGGVVGFRALRGTGNRAVSVNANGQLNATPAAHYVSIPASAFQPRDGSFASSYTAGDVNGMAGYDAGTTAFATAPVSLPHGAVVTSFKVYYVDNSASNLTFVLITSNITAFTNSTMSTLTSAGTSGSNLTMSTLEDTSISLATVDNTDSVYYINVGPAGGGCCWDGPALRIKGVLITYTL